MTSHLARVTRCDACAKRDIGRKNAERYAARRWLLAEQLKIKKSLGMSQKQACKEIGISPSKGSQLSKEFGISWRERASRQCDFCGAPFQYSPSQNRKFCSYECHLKSGGARRAGDASAMAKLKYGAKKDANHNEIIEAMRLYTAVHDLSSMGCGCPDGIAWIKDGWHFFDIKNPKTGYGRRGLNKRQKEWASDWRGGPVFLIYSVEQGLDFVRGNWDGIKREGGFFDCKKTREQGH